MCGKRFLAFGSAFILSLALVNFEFLYLTLMQKNEELSDAAQYGQHARMRLLLFLGADPNTHPNYGRVLPLTGAAFQGDNEAIRILLAHGARINGAERRGMTALMDAAYRGHRETALLLLAHGADASMVTMEGDTALTFAVYEDQADMVSLLLEHGAGRHGQALRAFKLALWRNRTETAKVLLVAGVTADELRNHPELLQLAAARGNNSEIINFLRQAGGRE